MKEKREAKAVSQGGTQPLFMIPQIVNPGSNFLPLVHNAAEVSAGFISHFPVIGQADKAPARKINSKNKVSIAVFEGTNLIPERLCGPSACQGI